MKRKHFILSPMFYGFYLAVATPFLSQMVEQRQRLPLIFVLYIFAILYQVGYGLTLKKKKQDFQTFFLSSLDVSQLKNFDHMDNPVVCFDQLGTIVWVNDLFRGQFMTEKEKKHNVKDVIPQLIEATFSDLHTLDVSHENLLYTATFILKEYEGRRLFFTFLKEDTKLKTESRLYQETRPCIINILLDNFDECLSLSKESTKNQLVSQVEHIVESLVSDYNGIFNRVAKDKFSIVVNRSYINELIKTKFKPFQQISALSYDDTTPITLSIGVGMGGQHIADNYNYANQALDMALGRGGDQCVVKDEDNYQFFGEALRGNQRRSKVKSKFMSNALVEMITTSDNVVVMGHKFADFDSLASAFGVWRMATLMKKQVHIAINLEKTVSDSLIAHIKSKNETNLFVGEETALELITPKTLLVIVDTHAKALVQFASVYEKSSNIFVIDHHRKVVDYIDNAIVFYHEPTASSTSEMVTEMLQYFAIKHKNIDNLTAEALLAGISLDTRNFSIRTNVRTFDAASYLRQCGADPITVRKLFSQSSDVYKIKNYILSRIEEFHHCGISFVDLKDKKIRTIAPQTADEMLQINGIDASFVLFQTEGEINVSARSFGQINVQIIMEKLGGGGHLTMAGAQIQHATPEEVIRQLKQGITEYFTK